jgi:hypothetical protein
MTKKTATEAVEETVKTDDDKAYDRERDEQYLRRTALDLAVSFHKNNGGMLTSAQFLAHAQEFFAFIKGETK